MSSAPRHDRKPVTLTKLHEMRALGEPIVMVTAYDHPSAVAVEEAGVDVVLVGDSAANNVLGYADTVPVTIEELLMLAAAVRRGLKAPLLVGDLPFGSYEASDAQAIGAAHRFVKEAGCDAVKLEGGGAMAERARAIVRAGVPVMGHVGLTPQTATALGGYRAQGRTAARARQVLEDALALQEAGCFAIVFEAIPAEVTDVIMQHMEIPIIGIGAGSSTDGQVLVLHDLLGIHDGFQPKFVKRYADVKKEMVRGVRRTRRTCARAASRRPSTRTGSPPRSSTACGQQLPPHRGLITARSQLLTAGNADSFPYSGRHAAPVSAVRAQGTRVLRPLRGGRSEHRACRRAARADARATGPTGASCCVTSSSASRKVTGSRTTSSSA